MRNKLRRPLAFLLSAVMIVTMSGTPVHAVADRGQPETGLCEHHATHTDDCGYTEEAPGTPCGHEHTEDCYIEVAECVHKHTSECYPVETEDSASDNEATPADAKEREPENCLHICDKESGCITEKLNCQHEHDGKCGYTESTPGTPCTFVCEICNPQDSGEADKEPETGIVKQEQCSCLTLCTEGQINPDCPVCGGLGAGLSDCKGEAEEENTGEQEDTGICKHHQEHDADCGYIPKSEDGEGSPCTYECRICPIEDLIADLPDKVTEDNAEEVRAQLEEILALYGELNEDEQEQIDFSRCYALQGALDAANAPMTADGHTEQQDTDKASVTIGAETLYYATLEEAFDAANGKTATITMLNDAECVHSDSAGSPLNITGGNVTLNLNGKTLSGNGYGNYGIINVSGGSLLVEGGGSISVASVGLSCHEGGKLTVEGITLKLVGDDIHAANAGVGNAGGTVILNGTQMTGAASEGQIYHHSGTTTINSVTATEATESNPESVYYQGDSGTLTINGGTFGKITVSSYNNGGVQSVAGLLGEGCAYKKQDGTWATDDELAAMEISNVTVEKIPLTINPQGDTSWYYSTQQTHTLAMNAAPVDSSDSVTYVWKSGTETLDCTSDTCTVPAGTPVGNYTYTCGATCDGYTLSHTFTFKIEKSGTEFTGGIKTYKDGAECSDFTAGDTITVKATPTATGAAPQKAAARLLGGPDAGQMALYVGNALVSSEAADADADGTYTMTVSAADVLLAAGGPGTEIPLTAKFVGNDNMAGAEGTVKVSITAAAKAEKGGAAIGYYGESNLAGAFARNSGNDGATITLLDNITTSTLIQVNTENLTLDLNGKTYTCTDNAFLISLGSLTITGSGEVTSTSTYCLAVNSGTLNIENGSFYAKKSAVYVSSGTIQLTGGSFTGDQNAIAYASGDVTAALANYGGADDSHYAFYEGSSPYAPSGNSLPSGTFTVQECQHTGVEATNNNDGTHSVNCPYCGYTSENEPHNFNETGYCPACKLQAAAKVEKDGSDTVYVEASGLNAAFKDKSNSGATITLLDNITTSTSIHVYTDNLTLDLNGKTYTCTDAAFFVYSNSFSLTIKGSGAITSSGFYCLNVYGGTLNIESGSFSGKDSAVIVRSGGTLQLTGGSFTGGQNAIKYASGDVKDALKNYGGTDAPHYAFYQDSSPYTPSGNSLPSGTFTVQECQHTGVEVTNLGDGKHGLTCPYCGYHYEHTTTLTATASGNNVTLNGGCGTEGCGYQTTLGTAFFTFPKVTYGQSGDVTCTWDGPMGYYGLIEVIGGSQWQFDKNEDENIAERSWTLAQLFGSTKVTAGKHKLKVSFFSDADVLSNECELDFTIDPAPLTDSMVTLSAESVTYNGTEQKSALTVKHGETTLTEGTDYEVRYTRDGVVTNDFTSAGTVKITVTGKGNYTGTVTKEYAISKADVLADNLAYTQPADLFYTGQPKTAVVTANNLTGIGEITVKYKKDNSGDLLAEAKEPGTYYVYADISAGQNYNAAQIEMGSFTISYMATPTVLYNGGEKKDWYNGDVDVSAGSAGYTVSDAVDGDYKSTYHISAQEGTVAKTLYFMDASGHISEGVDVEVNFDLTPPTGEIAVGKKWWQNFLHFISFGNYAAKEYTVTIKAEDTGGSGVDNDKTEYAIVTGADQYTDADALKAANVNWMAYDNDSRHTIPVNSSPYVVYARLTDNAGNVTYISTDGILLDSTAPAVDALTVPEETKKDVTAGVTFTVSEAADYYYVVLPESSDAPSAEDIIVTCGGTLPEGTGTAIAGMVSKGSGAVSADTPGVSVEAKNLQPYTAYMVYVTAVDRAVDITDSAQGIPAGNIAVVQNVDFTTKKTLPVITKTPAVAGTYGQSVGEMAITGGTAQAGSTVLAGTWTVSDADKNEKPSAGTSEVTVIFTPDNANYDSVSVQASLTVSQRNLNAEGVTVSEVAGNYTYTGSEIKPSVAVDTGTPTSGISISDSGAALTANDFTVSYSNNKDAGTASVTITGKGNYAGSVTRTFTIGKAPGREVPDVSGSHTDNGQTYTYTVTPTEGAVYRMDNGVWQAENIFKDIKPGTSVTFYAMMPEDKNYEEGTPKYITVNFPKLTPAAPALTYKADRTNPADVKVAITPVSGAEYSFDGGKTWTESNEQGGFTTSQTVTLAIRLKETGTHNQSPARTMTVNLAKEDREAPPAFSLKVEANGETDYTVTIPATEGCEYSFDGEHWSDVNVKTGVSVGETVTGYKRYKETNDYNASSAVFPCSSKGWRAAPSW